jgi:hypothetical protein
MAGELTDTTESPNGRHPLLSNNRNGFAPIITKSKFGLRNTETPKLKDQVGTTKPLIIGSQSNREDCRLEVYQVKTDLGLFASYLLAIV